LPQDNGDIAIEAKLIAEKGFYDAPIRIYIYGTSDYASRLQLEERLKSDKLLKATQLKQTRTANDLLRHRREMGLKSGQSSAGLGSNGYDAPEPQVSLEQLTQASQAVQFRTGDDIAKTIAMDEDTLAQMPMAEQPQALKATLLPYQLQVHYLYLPTLVESGLT
jgi:SWI/SNF-related matrix-associated actin-dependent regulator of chromatin subfamily A3